MTVAPRSTRRANGPMPRSRPVASATGGWPVWARDKASSSPASGSKVGSDIAHCLSVTRYPTVSRAEAPDGGRAAMGFRAFRAGLPRMCVRPAGGQRAMTQGIGMLPALTVIDAPCALRNTEPAAFQHHRPRFQLIGERTQLRRGLVVRNEPSEHAHAFGLRPQASRRFRPRSTSIGNVLPQWHSPATERKFSLKNFMSRHVRVPQAGAHGQRRRECKRAGCGIMPSTGDA